MIKEAKVIACLYTGIVAANSTDVVKFNGFNNTQNEYLNFIQGTEFNVIGQITIKNEAMNLDKNVILEIPAVFEVKNGILDQTAVGEKAFKELKSDHLRLTIKFISIKGKYVRLPQDCFELFSNSNSIVKIDFSDVDSSCVTNAWRMFWGCNRLENVIFGKFNTANIRNMEAMFMGCSKLKHLDLSNFNTKNVETMQSMFNACYELESLDICRFNTEKVTNMSHMFQECKNLGRLGLSEEFTTKNVTNKDYMLEKCRPWAASVLKLN